MKFREQKATLEARKKREKIPRQERKRKNGRICNKKRIQTVTERKRNILDRTIERDERWEETIGQLQRIFEKIPMFDCVFTNNQTETYIFIVNVIKQRK